MSQMIQSLERRMLMSVTAATLATDVSTGFSDGQAAIAAHTARYTAAHNDIQAIVLDLRGLDTKTNRAANNRLAAALSLHGAISHLKIVADQSAFLATAKIEALLGYVYGKGLLNHPTSTAFARLVANNITNLNTKVPAKLTALQTELTTATNAFNADLNAIATANPSLAGVVSSFESDVAAKTAAYSTAAQKVETDTSQLATDLAAIPT